MRPRLGAMQTSKDFRRSMSNTLDAVLSGLEAIRKDTGEGHGASPVVTYLLGATSAMEDPNARGLLLSLLANEYSYLELVGKEEAARKAAIAASPS